MWGGALDPEPRAPPAAAPYPDAQYAMTASEFDARLETWGASAHDGSFDAQFTKSLAWGELMRNQEIRAAVRFALIALVPLTVGVFHTFAALPLPESFDTDPVPNAMALRGACDIQNGEVEKVQRRLRAAFAAFVALLAAVAVFVMATLAVSDSSPVVVLLRVVGERVRVSRITTTQETTSLKNPPETKETKRDEEENTTRTKPVESSPRPFARPRLGQGPYSP